MNICAIIDDRGGMSFFGKRQSRDKLLIARLLSHTEYKKIYISPYSEPLFCEFQDERVCVTEHFPFDEEEALCFFELDDISEFDEHISNILLYKWNRHYPSDKRFPYDPNERGYTLLSSVDFKGNSHDNITEEIWTK